MADNEWSLEEFARLHGKMHVRTTLDEHTGNKGIDRCAFIKKTYTYVSKSLQGHNRKWIVDNMDKLVIRQFEDGSYCLCMKWEEVDLGI